MVRTFCNRDRGIAMAQTKMIDVFNQNKRQIRCIANEHDYL